MKNISLPNIVILPLSKAFFLHEKQYWRQTLSKWKCMLNLNSQKRKSINGVDTSHVLIWPWCSELEGVGEAHTEGTQGPLLCCTSASPLTAYSQHTLPNTHTHTGVTHVCTELRRFQENKSLINCLMLFPLRSKISRLQIYLKRKGNSTLKTISQSLAN